MGQAVCRQAVMGQAVGRQAVMGQVAGRQAVVLLKLKQMYQHSRAQASALFDSCQTWSVMAAASYHYVFGLNY